MLQVKTITPYSVLMYNNRPMGLRCKTEGFTPSDKDTFIDFEMVHLTPRVNPKDLAKLPQEILLERPEGLLTEAEINSTMIYDFYDPTDHEFSENKKLYTQLGKQLKLL